jgi:hypothetical protein
MERSSAAPSWIARASAAKFMPTYSEFSSTCRRISAKAASMSFCGFAKGLASGPLRAGRTTGAISDFSTVPDPQIGQVTWPACCNASKAAADWNQLSKSWALSHFRL